MRKVVTYGVMGLGGSLIGLLLIPAAVLMAAIYGVWKLTDQLVRSIERH